MRKWLTHLFLDGSDERDPAPAVTLHRLDQVFEFGQRNNCTGLSLSDDEAGGLARLIDWQAEPRDWTILVASNRFQVGDQIVIPPHIKWSNNPHFRYVGVAKGTLEFRSGNHGQSAYFLADVTTDPDVIREIEQLFAFWYGRLQLPLPHAGVGVEITEFSSITRETPIRGFAVVSTIYPNHETIQATPFTGQELATLLVRSVDRDWFGADEAFDHFAVSGVVRGNAENSDCHAFDFGPFDQDSDEFLVRSTVIVRETAGGGFMLLIQDGSGEHATKITTLFEALGKDDRRTLSDGPQD